MKWRRFVTYLSNDPRISFLPTVDVHINYYLLYVQKCALNHTADEAEVMS